MCVSRHVSHFWLSISKRIVLVFCTTPFKDSNSVIDVLVEVMGVVLSAEETSSSSLFKSGACSGV